MGLWCKVSISASSGGITYQSGVSALKIQDWTSCGKLGGHALRQQPWLWMAVFVAVFRGYSSVIALCTTENFCVRWTLKYHCSILYPKNYSGETLGWCLQPPKTFSPFFSFFLLFVVCRLCTSKWWLGYFLLCLAMLVFVEVFVRDWRKINFS